jgi:hypothetical protein
MIAAGISGCMDWRWMKRISTFQQTSHSADGFLAKFRPEAMPPVFALHPENLTVSGGMAFTLRAEAVSSLQPIRYQWWFDGAPLAGETNTTLAVAGAVPRHSGRYHVVAENAAGMAQSGAAIVTYTDASALILSLHPSLQIFGTPGRTYTIEYATEVNEPARWIPITNITLERSPQLWVDPQAVGGARRYYRVLLQP